MRKDELDQVMGFVAKGLSVRITGSCGSGRTVFSGTLAEQLEESGVATYRIFAMQALSAVPFAGVLGLGLDIRSRMVSILGMADLLSAQLARAESNVIIIDNIDQLDKESLAVVNVAKVRTAVPLVITTNDWPFNPDPSSGLLSSITDATVKLLPLGFDQTRQLVSSILGAPVDVDVVAHVMTKSGGNVRLVVRMVETAILSERLVMRGGRWAMSGDGLMNEHLHGVVEGLFLGLGTNEVCLLRKLSLLGPTPTTRLSAAAGDAALYNLEAHGLISVIDGPEQVPLAAVFPPIVDDYLRLHVLGSKESFRHQNADQLGTNPASHPGSETTPKPLSSAMQILREEMRSNHAANTRYFQQRLEATESDLYHKWKSDPSLTTAVTLLGTYWGTRPETQKIQDVFALTDTNIGTREELFVFAVTVAWFKYSTKGDLAGAIAEMEKLAYAEPALDKEAKAFVELLELSAGTFRRNRAHPTQHAPKTTSDPTRTNLSGAHAIITANIELYKLNPDQALQLISSIDIHPQLHRLKNLYHSIGVFLSGETEKSLVLALEYRRKAFEDADQFAFVSQSYVTALALLHHGLYDETEYIIGRAFSLGRQGLFADAYLTAMLGLSSLRDAGSENPWGTEPDNADVIPFPGTGTGLRSLASSRPISAKAFDQEARGLVEEYLDSGFVLQAMHTAMFALGLLPGPRVLELLRKILTEHALPSHNQYLEVTDAAINGDLPRLQRLLKHYTVDGDTYQIAMVLRGAEQRWKLSGETTIAEEVRRSTVEFTRRFQPMGTILNFQSKPAGSTLTLRENEVAMLAGHKSNHEIAKHFKISVRTVESHISNALRKTDTTTRKQLADLVNIVQQNDYQGTDQPHNDASSTDVSTA